MSFFSFSFNFLSKKNLNKHKKREMKLNIFLLFFLSIVFLIGSSSSSNIDYCRVQKEKCKNRKHIKCEPDAFINRTAVNIQVLNMTTIYKEIILDEFNRFRQNVARGWFDNSDAGNMKKMASIVITI